MFEHRPEDLNAAHRARSLTHLSDHEVDVLVIGGGVTGAGVALDAATRGLSVALCEVQDLASGTSGFSSKLVHGGLRYLARGDIALAWESAVEREALMRRIAPHLVHSRAFLVPRFSGEGVGGLLTEAGIRLADILRAASGLPASSLPRPRRIDARAARLLAPSIRTRGLHGGVVYWDGAVEDDTRLVVALARTAARHGAHIVTGCRVVRATATEAWIDAGDGVQTRVRARAVVNATGVWAEEFAPGLDLTPSRGTHLAFSSATFGYPRAVLTAPVPGQFGRYVFVLPQANGLCYLGLTDESAPGADGHRPHVPEEDIDFLLRTANTSLSISLERSDILGTFAGLRPLIAQTARRHVGSSREPGTSDTSRRHLVLDSPGAPITVAGGKLTVYRRMAQDAVDAVIHRLGELPKHRPSVTRRVPVIGSRGSSTGGSREEAAGLSVKWPQADPGGEIASRLVRRYGWEAGRLAELARAEPHLAADIAPGARVSAAEVIFAVRAEGARTVADVLERRTRLALQPELARAAAPAVAALLEQEART